MSITFGGLATGMDTNAIVDKLMELERGPITRMEKDKAWLTSRMEAYTEFDDKLKNLLTNVEALEARNDLLQKSALVSREDFFTATADNDAFDGTNYNIEVVELAQVQKNITRGFSDKLSDQFGTGTLSFTIDGVTSDVTIAAGEGSLEGIMNAINDADLDVSAAIINDGTTSPYRLMLSGKDVGKSFSINTTRLSNGELLDPESSPIAITQEATQAHIRVDNIDIYSNSNTLTEAIPGVTINLLKAEPGTLTGMNVKIDDEGIKEKIQAFVDGYNGAVSFVTGQSVINGSEGGILRGDSGLSAIKRHLQDLLTTEVSNSGTLRHLSELGLKTQKDGTLIIDSKVLDSAIQNNLEDVERLMVGEEGITGIATQFKDYLESITDSFNGLKAGRKTSIDSNLRRLDDQIDQAEMRLEKKEETLRARFDAMEALVSGMNSQSSFLAQQMTMFNNMVKGN